MYRNRIRTYKNAAQQGFNQFSGYEPSQHYMNANGAGNGGYEVLDPNNRTLTIKVVNASVSQIANVMLFGSVKDLTDSTKNSNITITVAESSHLQVKTELLQNVFRIVGLKYVVTTVAQFSNTLFFYEEDSTGGLIKRPWQPLNHRSAQNTITTQIDALDFEFLCTANTYLLFNLAGSETVTFTFTIVEKAIAKNLLRGGPQRAVARQMAPTGLPQMDQAPRV